MSPQARRSELVLVVSRSRRSPFGYRWELRRFDHGVSIESSTRSYASEGLARQAGQAAMLLLQRSAPKS